MKSMMHMMKEVIDGKMVNDPLGSFFASSSRRIGFVLVKITNKLKWPKNKSLS